MIEVDNVTKRYGATLAVDEVSFRIGAGEIVGFLGPNGAGKSTLLKLISTWMEPDAGSIRIAGHDTRQAPLAVRRSLGYLPEHNALYDGMRVDRFLQFIGAARGLSGARLRERIAWCVEGCRLEAVVHKRVHQCSKGYRQRIGVAASLIHDPPVIVLDEPTHGLDPIQVVAFRNFVQGLRKGRAILFSSHILSEVVGISERLLIIQHGRLLADAKVADLQRQARERGEDVERVVLEIVRSKAPQRAEVRA
jgi:ABC-2 type transport system ATP-binding protein